MTAATRRAFVLAAAAPLVPAPSPVPAAGELIR